MSYFEENTSSSGKFFAEFSGVKLPRQMLIHNNPYKFHMVSPLDMLFTNFEVDALCQFLSGTMK